MNLSFRGLVVPDQGLSWDGMRNVHICVLKLLLEEKCKKGNKVSRALKCKWIFLAGRCFWKSVYHSLGHWFGLEWSLPGDLAVREEKNWITDTSEGQSFTVYTHTLSLTHKCINKIK